MFDLVDGTRGGLPALVVLEGKKWHFVNPKAKSSLSPRHEVEPWKPSRSIAGIGLVALGDLFFSFSYFFFVCLCYRRMAEMVQSGVGRVGAEQGEKPAATAVCIETVLATLSLISIGSSSALQRAEFG